jgi:hypothetical protein
MTYPGVMLVKDVDHPELLSAQQLMYPRTRDSQEPRRERY